jgi:hypothetical protein
MCVYTYVSFNPIISVLDFYKKEYEHLHTKNKNVFVAAVFVISLKLKTTHISMNSRMDKQTAYSYNGIVFNTAICSNISESHKYNFEKRNSHIA